MTAPTVESLQAQADAMRAEMRDNWRKARANADLIETYDVVLAGPEAIAKEMKRLKCMLRSAEATRDQWMTTAGELRREVWALTQRLRARP